MKSHFSDHSVPNWTYFPVFVRGGGNIPLLSYRYMNTYILTSEAQVAHGKICLCASPKIVFLMAKSPQRFTLL